ncbi:MAG: PIN domain-containing protein, partial [Cyclobacteriaceae bacterium]|nr:PIN domain-containing protein [Cyclobacteriaceae bacterium]
MAKTKRQEIERKIFVLDTSVIIYAHNSIMSFDEHDVAIPITVLEEIDQFKKGNDTKNFEAREFTRLMDSLARDQILKDWNALNGPEKGKFKVLMYSDSKIDATQIFGEDKPDHRILNATLKLTEEFPNRKIILVSKDINLRLKAKSLGINAEDYTTGKVKNVNALYTGIYELDKVSPEI